MTVFQPGAKHPIDELFNWQKDTSVEPPVLTFGQLLLSANGNYIKWDGSVSARNPDAGSLRVSSVQDSGTNLNISAKSLDAGTLLISAKQGSADQLRVSAFSPDAAFFRVSGIGTFTTTGLSANQSISALNLEGTAFVGNVSAKNTDAGTFLVSAKQESANLLRVSTFIDSGSVSAKSSGADTFLISAKQGDAGLLRVSAELFGNSLGSFSIYRSISISSAKNIKTTAGAIYGMDLFSTSASTLQFVKFYNTSATPTLGTDVPVMTIPLSAAGGVKPVMTQYSLGIAFSNGIAIGATSALADNATTTVAASSVIGNIYYI